MTEYVMLHLADEQVPPDAERLIAEGLERVKGIDWFDFVASDYQVVYTVLAALRRGRFCEWGSGMGVVTGLAAMLGYNAYGVELHEPLVERSKALLRDFKLPCRVELGDYLEREDQADLYFAYCWPNRVMQLEEHFHKVAPRGSRLLVYYGRNDVRCLPKQ